MKFKKEEDRLLWEAFNKNVDFGEDMFDDENSLEDGDDVIMNIEPVGEVEPSFDDFEDTEDDHDCCHDDFDDDSANEAVAASLRKLVKRSNALVDLAKDRELESWMIAKIIKAESYISDIWDELEDTVGFEDSDDVRF